MSYIFQQYLITFGWAITGAVSMSVALSILVKIFSYLTPIDEWEEIRKGNMAVAVIISAVVVATAIVIGFTVKA